MKKRLLALVAVLSASPLLRATDIEIKIDLAGTERVVVIRLDEEIAPKTSKNFAKLSREEFYKGIAMHRVIPNYIVQTGDPLSKDPAKREDWGTGELGYTIPAELGGKHVRGAVAAARLGDAANPERASSGSQFYVVLRDIPQLDGQYTVFGKVVSGLETFDEIASAPSDEAKVPTVPITILGSRVVGDAPPPAVKAPETKPAAPVPVIAVADPVAVKAPLAKTATESVVGAETKPLPVPIKPEPKPAPVAVVEPVSPPATPEPKPVPVAIAEPVSPPAPPEPKPAPVAIAEPVSRPATPEPKPAPVAVAEPVSLPATPTLGLAPLASEPDPLRIEPETDDEKPPVTMAKLTLNDSVVPPAPTPLPAPVAMPRSAPAAAATIRPEADPLSVAAPADANPKPVALTTGEDPAEPKKQPSITDLAVDTMPVNGDRGLQPMRLDPNRDALARATESVSTSGIRPASNPNDGFIPLSSVGNFGGVSAPPPAAPLASPAPAAPVVGTAPAPVESTGGVGYSFGSSDGTGFQPDSKRKSTPEPEALPEPKPAAKPKAKPKPAAPAEISPPPVPASDASGYQPLALDSGGGGGQPTAPAAEPSGVAPAAAPVLERPKGFIGRFIRRVW